MPHQPGRDWGAIQLAYEQGGMRVADLARQFGISNSALYARVNSGNWKRRTHDSKKADAMPHDSKKKMQPAAKAEKGQHCGRAESQQLADKVYRQIARQVSLIEKGLEPGFGSGTDAEVEKSARTLGILVRVLEKLTELQASPGNSAAHSGGEPRSEQDAERLRERLAQRLARLHGHTETNNLSGKPETG